MFQFDITFLFFFFSFWFFSRVELNRWNVLVGSSVGNEYLVLKIIFALKTYPTDQKVFFRVTFVVCKSNVCEIIPLQKVFKWIYMLQVSTQNLHAMHLFSSWSNYYACLINCDAFMTKSDSSGCIYGQVSP